MATVAGAVTEPSYLRATREFYDTIAADYAERFRTELAAKPLDRTLLGAFAELVEAEGGGPVADVGCGPGQVAGHLHALGLSVVGVDLSPAMLALARRSHPEVRFVEGSMTALGVRESAFAGIVAWYSVIHLPPPLLPVAFAELRRTLAPGGYLLVAFQVGNEPLRVAEPFGHPVALDFHRLAPDRVAGLMEEAGLTTQARLLREPVGIEKVRQAFLLAQRDRRTD